METRFFEGGPDAASETRPQQLSAVESLPALYLLERGGIMMAPTTTTADAAASADLAASGRRHSSLDSARSTVPGREQMQQCDVMSEDEPGLLKQQQQKSTKQHETCVGSKAEEQEEKEEREVGATRAPEEKAAAKNPPPPRASSSAPTEDGTGEKREKNSSPSPALSAPPPAPPLNPAAALALAACQAPSASPDFVCCDPAVPAYVERHSRVAARLARAMDERPNEGSSKVEREAHDALLLSLVGECGAAARGLRDARCAALDAGRVAEVAAGAFLHPGQRLLAWMGGIRPTDYLSCGRAMLAVWGEALSPEAAASLSQLQAAVAEQQQSMTAAFTELSERLARTAAVARYVRASSLCAVVSGGEEEEEEGDGGDEEEGEEEGETSAGSGSEFGRRAAAAAEGAEDNGLSPRRRIRRSHRRPAAPPGPRAADRLLEPPSPAASGIVDDMRSLLRHADELRSLVAVRISEPPPGGLLSPRQQALFWLCVQDIIELYARPTPRARPRAALGGGGGLSVRRPPEGARGGGQ